MKNDNILNLMVNHHALLEALFVLFRDEAKEKSPRTGATLGEFAWETKKHFFAEESAIFDYLPMESYGMLEVINQLKDEHIEMLSQLKKFAANLDELKDEDVESFSKLLEAHRKIEEINLYPKLDKELRDGQKVQIISRINEIPIHE